MTSGLTVADAMALQNSGMRGDGFLGGYGAGDFILGLIFGGAFGGFGGFGNRGYAGDLGVQNAITRQDINDAIGNQTITMKLDGISNGLCDSTYATNQNISSGFANTIASQRDSAYSLNNTIKDLGYNLISAQKDCCCDTNTNILRLSNQLDKNTCDIITNANSNTRDLIDSGNTNTQRIIDFLTNEKICSIQSENLALKGQLSQLNQTSNILASVQAMIDKATQPCPTQG